MARGEPYREAHRQAERSGGVHGGDAKLLFGTGLVDVRLPADVGATVVRKAPMPVAEQPAQALRRALAAPYASLPLHRTVKSGDSVCIAVCDVTRPVPNRLLLDGILNELAAAGVPNSAVTVVVATGLHRPNQGDELTAVLGDPRYLDELTVVNHRARSDGEHVRVGVTRRGTPVLLDRRFVQADVRIVTGLVEPHFMAGYSGGRKVIAPGLAHADTIRHLHSHRFMGDPRCAPCRIDGNPLNEELVEIARMVGPVLAVNAVIDEARRPSAFTFGDVVASHEAAVTYVRRYVEVPVARRFPTVVTSAAGFPLDATFYQTVKAMVAPLEIVEPGGDLIVVSQCSEGLGSRPYAQAQRRLVELGVDGFLAEASSKGAADIDEWQTEMQARALKHCTVTLVTEGLSRDELQLTATRTEASLEAAIAGCVERHQDRSIAVIPEGPYVVPKLMVH